MDQWTLSSTNFTRSILEYLVPKIKWIWEFRKPASLNLEQRAFGPKLCNSLLYHLKSAENLITFKGVIKKWNWVQFECSTCSSLLQSLFIHFSFYYLIITFIMYRCWFWLAILFVNLPGFFYKWTENKFKWIQIKWNSDQNNCLPLINPVH